MSSKQKIQAEPGFQVPFAAAIRAALPDTSTMRVGAVGLLTEPQQCEEILQQGEADVLFMARQFLREPYFPLRAAHDLGVTVPWAPQNERGCNSLHRDYFSGRSKDNGKGKGGQGVPHGSRSAAPVAGSSALARRVASPLPKPALAALMLAGGLALGYWCGQRSAVLAPEPTKRT